VPGSIKDKILQRLTTYFDGDADDRIVVRAAQALAAFCELTLKQQWLDLAREKIDGKQGTTSIADLVAEAEQRAEDRLKERNG
jgi:hypothetical protein